MTAVAERIETTQTFTFPAVQAIVVQTANSITMKIVESLMAGLAEKLDFAKLADKHISIRLKDDLAAADEKSQVIYQKLLAVTKEHIQANSKPVATTLMMITQQTNNAESSELFLGTFVWNATQPMIDKLRAEQPGAVECVEIWA